MEPYSPDVSISILLTLAGEWIRGMAQRRLEEETARTAAKVIAKDNGSVRPELSRNDFNLLYKEFKNENPRVGSDDWLSDFKGDFERVQVHKKIAKEAE